MHLDILFTYKEKLNRLSAYESLFKRLEGHSSVCGATKITMLETLGESLTNHIKDAMTFVDHPFDEAVIDNLLKSGEDVGSTLQVVEYTPSDLDFDARDVVCLDKLNKLVETIYRCTVAIKSKQGLSMPRALITLDLIVHEIITQTMLAVCGHDSPVEEFPTITGKSPMNEIITFTLLQDQKYYNEDEKQAIRDHEEARLKAIRDAEEVARRTEMHANYLGKIEKIMSKIKGNSTKESFATIPDDVLVKGVQMLMTLDDATLAKFGEKEWFGYDPTVTITAGGIAAACQMLSIHVGATVKCISSESRLPYDDVTCDDLIDAGESVTFGFE